MSIAQIEEWLKGWPKCWPKCWLVAGLVLAGTGAAAQAQSASARGGVQAQIIAPLTITALADLDFGGVALAGAVAGQVSLDPASGAAHYQGVTPAGCDSGSCPPRPARFAVRGEAGRAYRIVLPVAALAQPASGSGPALLVSALTAGSANRPGGGALGLLDHAGADELAVGGTLAVPALTVPGRYVAQLPVLVSYD